MHWSTVHYYFFEREAFFSISFQFFFAKLFLTICFSPKCFRAKKSIQMRSIINWCIQFWIYAPKLDSPFKSGIGFKLVLDSLVGARKLKTPYLSIREILSSALYEKTVKLLFFLLHDFDRQTSSFTFQSKGWSGLLRPIATKGGSRRRGILFFSREIGLKSIRRG